METDYGSPPVTRAWVDGYALVSPQRFLYNVGDIAGCPALWQPNHAYVPGQLNRILDSNGFVQEITTFGTSGSSQPDWNVTVGGTTKDGTAVWINRGRMGACDGGWKQDDVWYVSWGADPAQPLPEVYQTTSAEQWAGLSLYGYLNPARRNGGSVVMAGALTELGACTQYPNDATCKPTPFTPTQGWQSLFKQLNDNPHTAQSLPSSTDISVCDAKYVKCEVP